MANRSGSGNDKNEPVRTSWHGMGQRRPTLPHYLRPSKRLKSLDEFGEPEWKGRTRWARDDRVTLGGVAHETLQWLAIFAIVGIVGGAFWKWLGSPTCAEIVAGFKIGWC